MGLSYKYTKGDHMLVTFPGNDADGWSVVVDYGYSCKSLPAYKVTVQSPATEYGTSLYFYEDQLQPIVDAFSIKTKGEEMPLLHRFIAGLRTEVDPTCRKAPTDEFNIGDIVVASTGEKGKVTRKTFKYVFVKLYSDGSEVGYEPYFLTKQP